MEEAILGELRDLLKRAESLKTLTIEEEWHAKGRCHACANILTKSHKIRAVVTATVYIKAIRAALESKSTTPIKW